MAKDGNEDSPKWDPREFVSPDLNWHRYWNQSPALLQIWAQTAMHFDKEGVLEQLILKGPKKGEARSIMAAIGLGESSSPRHPSEIEPKENQNDRVGGYLHVVPPFMPEEDMWVTGIHAGESPWRTPTLMTLRGISDLRRQDGDYYVVTFEKPIETFVLPWQHSPSQLANRSKTRFSESLHLERFCTDHMLSTGSSPYDGFLEGSDPPDFVVWDPDGRYDLECTQITLSDRRKAYGLFSRLQDTVIDEVRKDRNRFRKIRGCMVYAYFDSEDAALVLPPRSSDVAFLREIAEALAAIDLDFQTLWVDRGAPPPAELEIPAVKVGPCGLYAVPMMGAFPLSQFSVATGFEIGLGFKSFHRPEEEWERLRELVDRKDRNGRSKHLLVTAGGPDDRGLCFPSEDWILGSVVEEKLRSSSLTPLTTESLQKVYLHFWNTGWIVQLVPELRVICPPRFPYGYVPGHLLAGLPVSDEGS